MAFSLISDLISVLFNIYIRIIDPLASRCAKFRFKPLSNDTLVERIKYICDREQIRFTPEVFSLSYIKQTSRYLYLYSIYFALNIYQLGQALADVSGNDYTQNVSFIIWMISISLEALLIPFFCIINWWMIAGGDLRKAITYLQSTHSLYGEDTAAEHIEEIAGV